MDYLKIVISQKLPKYDISNTKTRAKDDFMPLLNRHNPFFCTRFAIYDITEIRIYT